MSEYAPASDKQVSEALEEYETGYEKAYKNIPELVARIRADAAKISGLDQIAALPAIIERENLTLRNELKRLREKINDLYPAIAHGDEDHRAWLKKELVEHFKEESHVKSPESS